MFEVGAENVKGRKREDGKKKRKKSLFSLHGNRVRMNMREKKKTCHVSLSFSGTKCSERKRRNTASRKGRERELLMMMQMMVIKQERKRRQTSYTRKEI